MAHVLGDAAFLEWRAGLRGQPRQSGQVRGKGMVHVRALLRPGPAQHWAAQRGTARARGLSLPRAARIRGLSLPRNAPAAAPSPWPSHPPRITGLTICSAHSRKRRTGKPTRRRKPPRRTRRWWSPRPAGRSAGTSCRRWRTASGCTRRTRAGEAADEGGAASCHRNRHTLVIVAEGCTVQGLGVGAVSAAVRHAPRPGWVSVAARS